MFTLDMNLICNTNLTTQGTVGKCECRRDMRWNSEQGECQIYLDVDCSKITYDTKPSANIMAAVDRANSALAIGENQMTPTEADQSIPSLKIDEY